MNKNRHKNTSNKSNDLRPNDQPPDLKPNNTDIVKSRYEILDTMTNKKFEVGSKDLYDRFLAKDGERYLPV